MNEDYNTLWLKSIYNFTSWLQGLNYLIVYILEKEGKEKRAVE